MEQTREKLAQAMVDRSPLSMILLDIDHFKNINDHYGHAWGDAALQHIVEICGRHLRVGDLFGRYGGEEFVICLAGMDLAGAGQLANRIREDMERERLQTPSGHIAVTSSFGVVEADGAELSLEELLSQADHALYASKRNGRNTVHLHSRSGIIGFIPV
jgi:diguanylate cyclase (GGDEF)-like protein